MVLYNALIQFAQLHPMEWAALIVFCHHVFDAAVDTLDSMPAPTTPGFQFVYLFLNKLAGNYRKKTS